MVLYVEKAASGVENVTLHRVLHSWTEGTDMAPGEEGQGTAATAGATWLFSSYPNRTWFQPGGAFVPNDISSQSSAGKKRKEWYYYRYTQ